MALTNFKGLPPYRLDPGVRADGANPAFSTTTVIDASTEKVAIVGAVWHPTVKTGTINIRKVHFRCGAVTFNAASVLRVSLQNVSATAGPPYQPDGTQDQTVDMTSLTANAMNTTGNLSADRAVDLSADSLGDANSRWLAVVWEYQTFTAADSVVINGISSENNGWQGMSGNQMLNTGSWAFTTNMTGIVILECDDGTFAFIENATVFSAVGSASVASGGAIRRAGLKFKFPQELKADRFYLDMQIPNGCDGRLVLYDSDGTTELRSVDIDNDAVSAAGVGRFMCAVVEPVTFTADTFYRWVFLASTATSGVVYYADVAAAGHMDGLVGGQDMHWTEHDGTNWTDTTTRRPHFVIGVSAVHDGTGGGLAANPIAGFVS